MNTIKYYKRNNKKDRILNSIKILPLVYINDKLYGLLGKERWGKRANKYDLIGGKIEENEQPFEALRRESYEEARLFNKEGTINELDEWIKVWNTKDKYYRIPINTVDIYVGKLSSEYNLNEVNNSIKCPKILKKWDVEYEMSEVKLIEIENNNIDDISWLAKKTFSLLKIDRISNLFNIKNNNI